MPTSAFWRVTTDEGRLLHERSSRPFADAAAALRPDSDPRLVAALSAQADDLYAEYVVELEHVLIEPTRGFAVRGLSGLVARSLPYAKPEHAPRPVRYLAKRALFGLRPRRMDVLVSLRDKYETNYWHVLTDVLPRLFVLEEQGIAGGAPVLVAKPLFEAHYFQSILRMTALGKRNWVVQDGRLHLRPRRALFCRPLRYHRPYLDRLVALLRPQQPSGNRRLFVTRRSRYRRPTNLRELERIAAGAGFEIVDPGELSFEAQRDLFASTRIVAGVHGAGLANAVFRSGGKLDLLELMPARWLQPQYFWLSWQLGFGYRALLGEMHGEFDFFVPPQLFERALEELLAREAAAAG